MSVVRPVIFIGMPRSGTTVIFEAFATHPELGWLSNYSNRLPQVPEVAAIHRLFKGLHGRKNQGAPLSLLERVLPEPAETYVVWERFFGKAWGRSFLLGRAPTGEQVRRCRGYMRRLLAAEGKKRLCVKFTGPPRKCFLEQVFPDAFFVNVIRHPTAVVASLLSVGFWRDRGLREPFWEGGLSAEDLEVWRQSDGSPAALAALQWCAVLRATESEAKITQCPITSVQYERFITSPSEETKRLVAFAGLDWAPEVERYLASQEYENLNNRATRRLSTKDIDLVERITQPYRTSLGY